MAPAERIERPSKASKAPVMPLYQAGMKLVPYSGIEPLLFAFQTNVLTTLHYYGDKILIQHHILTRARESNLCYIGYGSLAIVKNNFSTV